MADLLESLPKDPTEDEIQSLLAQLETMEDVDNCEELQSQIMETIQGYPELLQAMKQFNNEHAFEKEKVEFERLKLEEQISMLEKVIENGIKQTTDLQEIHHAEVDDLHNQIINLQKQVAAHVRFIDEHCVDSEEIRAEMQQDIDRLVVELEEQTKTNRTTDSLQQQVSRLEQESSRSPFRSQNRRKTAEVEDMNSQIQWFRNEYDSLLKKVVSVEEELAVKKSALEELTAENAKTQLQIKELELKSSGLQSQLEDEEKRSAEQLQMLKNSLSEEQKTSSRQKSELEKIKTELEKLKSLLAKSKSENEELESVKSENYSLATELELGKFIQETAKNCDSEADTAEKFAFLQKQLERRTAAYDDLRRENLRLREAADRRKRREKLHKSSKSSNVLSSESSDSLSGYSGRKNHSKNQMVSRSSQEDGGSNCESEDGGYCSSLRSLTRSLQSSSMMSLDQSGLEWRSQSFSSLLSSSNSPCASSTPLRSPRRLVHSFNDSQGSMEELSEDEDSGERIKKVYVKPQVNTAAAAAAPRLISSKTQTSISEIPELGGIAQDSNLKSARSMSDIRIVSDFDTSKYLTPLRIREIHSSRKTTRNGHEMTERLSRQLEDKREDIRLLRKMIREKDEALAAKSAECANLKRELRASSSSSSLSTPGSKMVHSNLLNSDLSDLKINLKDEGDPELYGHIDQIRPGQIQELKTVRKTIKDVDGKPVKYSTKVSVTCNKVAVFF
ncbi:Oidioi.mRNA.OKI2018_I69.XSR.g13292.t1.cds [Oikopleura dioica]|uniref:Oidioi.mRNA.OKI2018_I69.XSR.g13292.t1.cds n=1 Tax=Oikopleura dioica TaxID=34765 RepID=A0ABN7S6G8_OIKDI|nr:Oidioi.mRNA.OKI2018_I69.XSR.g13292.t1.cds [Oikopleura dioica]